MDEVDYQRIKDAFAAGARAVWAGMTPEQKLEFVKLAEEKGLGDAGRQTYDDWPL
jgi:hypothetical protein